MTQLIYFPLLCI